MQENRENIIARLQKEILPLQGLKLPAANHALQLDLGPIAEAFPNKSFPIGAIHEFISHAPEDAAATCGFIGCLTGGLMRNGGVCVWIGASRKLFPPALKGFGVDPDRIIFIDLKKDKEILWAIEEALKCEGLATVVGEIPEMNFTVSRRLQLAVEQSRVTGFIHRYRPRNINTNACISRWQITSLPSALGENIPGIGFPRWEISLLKIRNGKPGAWKMEWASDILRPIAPFMVAIPQEQKRKTG